MTSGIGDLTLSRNALTALREKIQRLYQQDDRPWVIGYSGGKDSTTVLQLIWDAVRDLAGTKPAAVGKPIFVLSSDTRVETPVVVDSLRRNLERMEKAAAAQGLPFRANLVTPKPDHSFWVNMIGRGYPAPTKTFRWCTDRLKIQPANQFILDQVSEFGEVVLVLGVRKEESATRAQSVMLHEKRSADPDFSLHSSLPGALVLSPIVDWSTHDVWAFLGASTPPWGGSHRELITMYRNAQAGECPLVVDKTTSSCGNSRFGCWTCTVVSVDRSMEALADLEDGSGEWLLPLLDLREFLATTTVPANKSNFRQVRRRDGSIRFKDTRSSTVIWGPYRPQTRVEILERLLRAEEQVRAEGPDPRVELISDEELIRIGEIWGQEPEPEFLGLEIERVVARASSRRLVFPRRDVLSLGELERSAILGASQAERVPAEVIARMLRLEESARYMGKRMGLKKRLLSVIDSSWESEEQVLAEQARRAGVEKEEAMPSEERDYEVS